MYGETIKKYLIQNGIKYRFLADKLKISCTTLGTMLNCKRKITIEEYTAICQALEVGFDFFYNKIEEQKHL